MGVEIHGKHHGTMMEFSLSQTVKDILAHLSTHYPEQNHTQQQTPIHHSQDLRSINPLVGDETLEELLPWGAAAGRRVVETD